MGFRRIIFSSVRVRKRTNKAGELSVWIVYYSDQKDRRHIKTFDTNKAAITWLEDIGVRRVRIKDGQSARG